jgi:hypothetical protein
MPQMQMPVAPQAPQVPHFQPPAVPQPPAVQLPVPPQPPPPAAAPQINLLLVAICALATFLLGALIVFFLVRH